MTTRLRFVSSFWDKAVEFWSKRTGYQAKPDVPCEKGSPVRWIQIRSPKGDTPADDQLSAAVRLVQRELDGVIIA